MYASFSRRGLTRSMRANFTAPMKESLAPMQHRRPLRQWRRAMRRRRGARSLRPAGALASIPLARAPLPVQPLEIRACKAPHCLAHTIVHTHANPIQSHRMRRGHKCRACVFFVHQDTSCHEKSHLSNVVTIH